MNTIRLACSECDRDDKDFITQAELQQCEAEGWEDITEEQTSEQACSTSGTDCLRWWTHLATCPDCKE